MAPDLSFRSLPNLSLPLSSPPESPTFSLYPIDVPILSPQAHTSTYTNCWSSFFNTRSRVLRVDNFRSLSCSIIASLLCQRSSPTPISIWALTDVHQGSQDPKSLYSVYRTHEEACEFLSLPPSSLFSVVPALESDLEPFHRLKRVEFKQHGAAGSTEFPIRPLPPNSFSEMNTIRQSTSLSDFREPIRLSRAETTDAASTEVAFPLSSNPPNPKNNFRLGDWLCASPCGAHNFGRNVTCIGCGSTRPTNYHTQVYCQSHSGPGVRLPFTRFTNAGSLYGNPVGMTQPLPQRRVPLIPPAETPKFSYPVLTPSGRQLSIGGKVQNISMNPLAPCFMFWSFNEPLPHPGQLRPPTSTVLQHPPILNTGNRGPIEHQPGDWICHKCNYLNWRRRKVCQTCYPYAEGNGDSVSTAMQAERISLLVNVLSSTSSPATDIRSLPPSPTSSTYSTFTSSLPTTNIHSVNSIPRSRSHVDLYHSSPNEQPIYQTSGGPGYSTTYGPLLPAFLQDMVHSPSLSPASSSSDQFSLEEYEDCETSPRSPHSLPRKPSSSGSFYNIWKLDGDETKALSAFAHDD